MAQYIKPQSPASLEENSGDSGGSWESVSSRRTMNPVTLKFHDANLELRFQRFFNAHVTQGVQKMLLGVSLVTTFLLAAKGLVAIRTPLFVYLLCDAGQLLVLGRSTSWFVQKRTWIAPLSRSIRMLAVLICTQQFFEGPRFNAFYLCFIILVKRGPLFRMMWQIGEPLLFRHHMLLVVVTFVNVFSKAQADCEVILQRDNGWALVEKITKILDAASVIGTLVVPIPFSSIKKLEQHLSPHMACMRLYVFLDLCGLIMAFGYAVWCMERHSRVNFLRTLDGTDEPHPNVSPLSAYWRLCSVLILLRLVRVGWEDLPSILKHWEISGSE